MKKVNKFVVKLMQNHVDAYSTFVECHNDVIGMFDIKPSKEILDALMEEQKAEILARQKFEYKTYEKINEEGKKVFVVDGKYDNDEYYVFVIEKLIAVD